MKKQEPGPSLAARLEEIGLLMRYAVPEEERRAAAALVAKYEADRVALNVFHNFYSFLPEGLEDSIRVLRLLSLRQGAFLICASSGQGDYLYLATSERAEFLGPLIEGILEDEVREFFGFAGREEFVRAHASLDSFPVHVPTHLRPDLCPFCLVGDGEQHVLGCPVEICPWCGGQLTSCPCRFAQLDKKTIGTEAELAALLHKLEQKGRIPFDPEQQRPSYPLTPLDLEE
ncbi:MAG: hypothetical protein ACOY3Z_13085 [Thermodesulfobacteriota bacterium]